MRSLILSAAILAIGHWAAPLIHATSPQAPTPPEAPAEAENAGVEPPGDYVVGADDVLGVLFWRDASLSGDVVVRPDGKITLPLLNEVDAAGLTTEALRERLTEIAKRFLDNPNVGYLLHSGNPNLLRSGLAADTRGHRRAVVFGDQATALHPKTA